MAPHSSTLAWKSPWTEEPGRLQSMGSLESDTTERLHFPFSLSCIGEGNGNPLQCSCLENPRDGGASWAAVSGVTQSRTWLKWLSSSSSSSGKGSTCQCRSHGFDPESGISPGIGNGNPSSTSILAWKIPWTEEPGRLQSMGLHRVSLSLSLSLSHTHPHTHTHTHTRHQSLQLHLEIFTCALCTIHHCLALMSS